MKHPITYSAQFDGEKLVNGELIKNDESKFVEAEIFLEGDTITVNNLTEEINQINFSFQAASADYNFSAQSNCIIPIIWY